MTKKYTCRTGTRRWPIHSFQTHWIWLLSMPGSSAKRSPMKTFLAETLYAHWPRSWLGHKCRNEITFQAKHHSLSATTMKKSQKNLVTWRVCARETALLECALSVKTFVRNLHCSSTTCLQKNALYSQVEFYRQFNCNVPATKYLHVWYYERGELAFEIKLQDICS